MKKNGKIEATWQQKWNLALTPLLLLLHCCCCSSWQRCDCGWVRDKCNDCFIFIFPLSLFLFFPFTTAAFHLRLVARLESLSILCPPTHSLFLSYTCSLTHTLSYGTLFARLVLNCWVTTSTRAEAALQWRFFGQMQHTHKYTECEHMHVCVCMKWIVFVCVCVVLVPIFTQCLCKLQQYLQILSARAHKNDPAGAARGCVYTHTHAHTYV